MVRPRLRDAAVGLFGLVARTGIQRTPPFDRLYLLLYDFYKRYFEAGPIDRLREFVTRGSLAIDVGANVGFFSVRFAEWVGSDGHVIAIEPEGENNRNLANRLARAGVLDRVDIVSAVAARTSGSATLEINQLHPADHKLSRDRAGIEVRAVTLDELAKNHPTKTLSLIKIDVQGAEMMVLEGADVILRTSRPALFVELHEASLKNFDTSVAEILGHLARYGYQSYWLSGTGTHQRATAEDIHARVAQAGYVDALFLKAG